MARLAYIDYPFLGNDQSSVLAPTVIDQANVEIQLSVNSLICQLIENLSPNIFEN